MEIVIFVAYVLT